YSTLVVRYSWCFLILGFVICIVLGLASIINRDLPDFNDPTKGFVPRGKHTLTSRLFVLERLHKELQGQMSKSNSETVETSTIRPIPPYDDDDYDDVVEENDGTKLIENLKNDLVNNRQGCAYTTISGQKLSSCLSNEQVFSLLKDEIDLFTLSRPIQQKLFNSHQMCTSINLNRHYEVYFESTNESDRNLLTLPSLQSLCKKQNELLDIFRLHSTCHYTLPQMIAYFNDKSDCEDLTDNDIETFLNRLQRCKQLHDLGILREVGLKRYKNKPLELFDYDSCFRYNYTFISLEYLLDKTFYRSNTTKYTAMWFIKPTATASVSSSVMAPFQINTTVIETPMHTTNFAYNLFLKYFYRNTRFDDEYTRLSGLNFLDIRIPTAMKQIRVDMFFVILAITLIIAVTILYLRSITVALMANICVLFSFACAYFSYKIVLGIDIFPYINLMATFILIGISCDNVFVIFDAWYSEKLDVYNEARLNNRTIDFYGKLTKKQELQYRRDRENIYYSLKNKMRENTNGNTKDTTNEMINNGDDHDDHIENNALIRMMKVNDEQMIIMMGGVLRHAAASVFVTSFTTSAAFFTNLITRIAYVQLFGLFMGFCILFNFLMNITMIVAFVIIYEKLCEPLSARLNFSKFTNIVDAFMLHLTRLNHKLFTVYIPKLIIKLRFLFMLFFLTCGIIGLIIVFYKPKLSPPKSRRYQFFDIEHPMEKFEYHMRDQFLSYINEDKENITNPPLLFIWGVDDTDTTHPFYPDDTKSKKQHQLVYNNKIDLYDRNVLKWFDHFLKELNQSDLFVNVEETYSDWLSLGRLIHGFINSNISELSIKSDSEDFFIPPTRNQTVLAIERLITFIKASSTIKQNFRIGFLPDQMKKIKAFIFIVNMNCTFSNYSTQDIYYRKLNDYFQQLLENIKLSSPSSKEDISSLELYEMLKHGWFVSPQFLFYDLMREVIRGTYTSLIFSMLFALVVLLLTSGNLLITLYAMITIIFIISNTVAVFVLIGWELNILETIIIIMSVGLSVDFTVHYGVAYIKADWKKNHVKLKSVKLVDMKKGEVGTIKASDMQMKANGDQTLQLLPNENNKINHHVKIVPDNKKISKFQRFYRWHHNGNEQRFRRVKKSLTRVGSAVFMAGFTSFLAGVSMAPSKLTAFSQMGFFLMLIMFTSWLYATWFFLPLCSFLGPIDKFGDIPFGKLCRCWKPPKDDERHGDDERKAHGDGENNTDRTFLSNNNNNNNNQTNDTTVLRNLLEKSTEGNL
ncbi:unnamed protein product, partial [Didymodactylos carnosus]